MNYLFFSLITDIRFNYHYLCLIRAFPIPQAFLGMAYSLPSFSSQDLSCTSPLFFIPTVVGIQPTTLGTRVLILLH